MNPALLHKLALPIFLFSLSSCQIVENKTAIIPKMLPIAGGNITLNTCPEGIDICPQHDYVEREVTVKSFKMAETEVTFQMYDQCVESGGCKAEISSWVYKNREVNPPCVEGEACNYPFDENWGRDSHPVINVSWLDTQKYIQWLNSLSIGTFRLPTTEEWEYAARANLETVYPWGDDFLYGVANCRNCGAPANGENTLEVARFSPNQFGLYDMVGNVAEWTSSCFPTREKGSQRCATYIYRGGSFLWLAHHLTPSSALNAMNNGLRINSLGFRLVQDFEEGESIK